jgi:hypothetical protein
MPGMQTLIFGVLEQINLSGAPVSLSAAVAAFNNRARPWNAGPDWQPHTDHVIDEASATEAMSRYGLDVRNGLVYGPGPAFDPSRVGVR